MSEFELGKAETTQFEESKFILPSKFSITKLFSKSSSNSNLEFQIYTADSFGLLIIKLP